MSIIVSPIVPEEAYRVWPIVAWIATNDLGFSEEAIKHFREQLSDEEIKRRTQSDRHVLLATRKNNEIAGILIGTPAEGGVATVLWLVVQPQCRDLGIGNLLFAEACNRYRSMGCHKIKLTASTKKAVGFYERQGMSVEGFHPKHWWHLDFWSLGKHL